MGRTIYKIRVFFVLIGFLLLVCGCSPSYKYDVAIRNGKIVSGDGNLWYKADIGIKGEKIICIGKIPANHAETVINAKGLVVCPGFIDIHNHSDRGITDFPTADNYLLQGVTTVVGGNCGEYPFPLDKLFKKIKKRGTAINFCCLIGHNTIREKVMGKRMADPTAAEMKQMKDLIDMEMKAGGMGLSTGLAYMPGTYAKTEELIDLTGVVARYGGFYASHIRNQSEFLTESIEEAIQIGEKNGIRIQISHVKLPSENIWGKLSRITFPIEQARQRGVEVTIDQYPYTATSSGFSSSFPSWCLEGGHEEFLKRLDDPAQLKKIKETLIKRRLSSTMEINKLKTIYIADYKTDRSFEGKSLEEILISRGKEPSVENGVELIIEIQKNKGASAVFFQMDERDVEKIMALDYTMIASDGAVLKYGKGVPHCRNYGTFPRIIHRYVKKKPILTLEEAIRKMTALPAQTLRLKNRGLIKENMAADIVIFDLGYIKDTATYSNPHQYPTGIKYVFVNGVLAAIDGKPTGKLPGKVIYGPGKK